MPFTCKVKSGVAYSTPVSCYLMWLIGVVVCLFAALLVFSTGSDYCITHRGTLNSHVLYLALSRLVSEEFKMP